MSPVSEGRYSMHAERLLRTGISLSGVLYNCSRERVCPSLPPCPQGSAAVRLPFCVQKTPSCSQQLKQLHTGKLYRNDRVPPRRSQLLPRSQLCGSTPTASPTIAMRLEDHEARMRIKAKVAAKAAAWTAAERAAEVREEAEAALKRTAETGVVAQDDDDGMPALQMNDDADTNLILLIKENEPDDDDDLELEDNEDDTEGPLLEANDESGPNSLEEPLLEINDETSSSADNDCSSRAPLPKHSTDDGSCSSAKDAEASARVAAFFASASGPGSGLMGLPVSPAVFPASPTFDSAAAICATMTSSPSSKARKGKQRGREHPPPSPPKAQQQPNAGIVSERQHEARHHRRRRHSAVQAAH